MSRRLIAIVGPTATGKTALAVALAQRFAGEIVGADSRQVYRHMDIGTAKPAGAERQAARHHLIDVVAPDEPFSLGRWLELAQAMLEEIRSRGRQPLLVGGTGQYVWALLEGWRVPRLPPQPALRQELEALPAEALVGELRRVDPQSAAQIDPRNVRRVVRALEVYRATGKPLSFWRTKAAPTFETLVIGLRLPRNELYPRIDQRVEGMVRAGLVDEVRRLLAMGYGRELPSMSGIGYKEMCEYLQPEAGPLLAKAGETAPSILRLRSGQAGSGQALERAVARIKTGTHRLARHQNSWFKAGDPRIRWIDAGERALAQAESLIDHWLVRREQTAEGVGAHGR